MPRRQIPKVDNQPSQPSLHNKSDIKLKTNTLIPTPEQSQPLTDTSVSQQFEAELCWCIQQLQRALTTAKMNPKQSNDALRSLNVLKNNSAPLVKKRQIMRSTFGDYRIKMAEEEISFKKAKSTVKFNMSSPSKKSQFIKRSAVSSTVIKHKELVLSDNSFRFNFEKSQDILEKDNKATTTTIDSESETISEKVNTLPTPPENYRFQSSDNSFRFGFQVEESSGVTVNLQL